MWLQAEDEEAHTVPALADLKDIEIHGRIQFSLEANSDVTELSGFPVLVNGMLNIKLKDFQVFNSCWRRR